MAGSDEKNYNLMIFAPIKKKEEDHTYIFPKKFSLIFFIDIKNAIRNVRIGMKSENKLIVQARK